MNKCNLLHLGYVHHYENYETIRSTEDLVILMGCELKFHQHTMVAAKVNHVLALINISYMEPDMFGHLYKTLV